MQIKKTGIKTYEIKKNGYTFDLSLDGEEWFLSVYENGEWQVVDTFKSVEDAKIALNKN